MSERAKAVGAIHGSDLGQRFYDKAERCFGGDYGTLSLPAVQALLILYMCSSGMDKDRAETMKRLAANEMLRRLKLERRFSKAKSRHDGAEQKRLRRVASKALWGVHCFDRYSKVP